MKPFLTKYILKTYIVVVLIEAISISLVFLLSGSLNGVIGIVLYVVLIAVFLVHAIAWILAIIYVFLAVQDISARRLYYWSLFFIVFSIIECCMINSYLPRC